MFDIGFTELMVIAVVALVVIGPERLPKVARTVGHLFGRMQRYVNDVKADINRELELDELRKFRSSVEEAAQSVQNTIHSEAATAQSEFNALTQEAGLKDATDTGETSALQELKELKSQVEEAGHSMQDSASSIEKNLRADVPTAGTSPSGSADAVLGAGGQPDNVSAKASASTESPAGADQRKSE
jgi:sec-independent protein translocase protein TatB